MRIRASDAARAVAGRLDGPDVDVDGASFDSRSLRPGELFVPIVAERDGHEFIDAAVGAGAAAYLTNGPRAAADRAATAIEVADTAAALMSLAAWARRRLDVPVVGITGSVGKTSTKDLVAAGLGATRAVTANERSFNNEQGLPVTILGAPDDVAAIVVEMGMRGFGEIARLCEVASPTIGVVTAVAAAHTERVGGIEGVARAKGELVEALPRSGVAVLNADDHRVRAMAERTAASIVTFGVAGDVRWTDLRLDELARPRCRIESPWGSVELGLAVSGEHMVANAAAALAVCGVVEGSIDAAADAIAGTGVSAMRMDVRRSTSGAVIVNDAYNANPDSVLAALDAIVAMRAERRIAVLGLMAEIDDPERRHREVLAEATDRGIDVIAVGTDLYGIDPIAPEAVPAKLAGLGEGDVVLVKASRAAALEGVAESLLEHEA